MFFTLGSSSDFGLSTLANERSGGDMKAAKVMIPPGRETGAMKPLTPEVRPRLRVTVFTALRLLHH